MILKFDEEQLSNLIKNAFREVNQEMLPATKNPVADQWFNLIQLCEHLPEKPKPSTVYGWIGKTKKGLLNFPYIKKQGTKALTFSKSEIELWQKRGRHKTAAELSDELAAETDNFLTSQKKKRKEKRKGTKSPNPKLNIDLKKERGSHE